MARRSPLAKAPLWIGLGVLAAIAARDLVQADGPPITARIPSEALPLEGQARGAEESQVAEASVEEKSEPPRLATTGPLPGDALLRGEISLEAAVKREDRYEVELVDGARAILTLEPKVQAAAEKVLKRAKAPKAAVVVMAVDGRVLALAGRQDGGKTPAYDLPVTEWAPAASVFKVVTAAALLGAGFDPDRETCYHGGFRSVEASHLKDSKRDEACIGLGQALSKSQNAVFAKLAHRHLDRRKLGEAARAFGLDSAPRFALPTEPNRFEIPEDPLEFAQVAAGFWKTRLSPLGGALVAGTIATGGLRVTPRIVSAVEHEDGRVRQVEAVKPIRVIREEIAREIVEMMVLTTEQGGTASRGFHDRRGRKFFSGIKVAGKTGSLTRDRPSYLAYSWFVGFAPADKPEVVIAVLLGNPERWHLKGSTAARLVLSEIF